mgnify:FL=1
MSSNSAPPFFSDYQNFPDSDREYLTNLVDLFSKILEIPIHVKFDSGISRHYVYPNLEREYRKKNPKVVGYTIVSDPNHADIDRKTAIEHELCHIAFETLMDSYSRISESWIVKDFGTSQNFNYKKPYMQKVLHACYNILEDQRIESLLSLIQTGSKIRFNRLTAYHGNRQFKNPAQIKEPVNALLASRQQQNKIVKQTSFKSVCKFIDQVNELDNKGGIILMFKFYKEILKPFFENQLSKPVNFSKIPFLS